jgi:branched-chain amino acid aminotransferase
LGVTAPSEALLFVIAVPWPDLSGDAVAPGSLPKSYGLKLLASKNDTRAWPGGFGNAKVGANYGPAFMSHMEGRKRGYDQILWLLNNEKEFEVTEAGASNFFVVWKTREGTLELITAPLDSKIILDGVTRRSVLDLARERLTKGSKHLTGDVESINVVERVYSKSCSFGYLHSFIADFVYCSYDRSRGSLERGQTGGSLRIWNGIFYYTGICY